MERRIPVEILNVRHSFIPMHLVYMRPEVIKVSLFNLSEPFYVEDLQKQVMVAVSKYTLFFVNCCPLYQFDVCTKILKRLAELGQQGSFNFIRSVIVKCFLFRSTNIVINHYLQLGFVSAKSCSMQGGLFKHER